MSEGSSTGAEPEMTALCCAGVTLAARRLGLSGGGRPVLVALHGGPGLDHHTLLPLARRLAGRFEVWLPDLPGHGASALPSGRLPGLEAVTRQAGGWLAGFPGGVDVLLGHSLGAWLVRELLRRRRLRPRAAVLLSPPAAGRRGEASAWRRAVEIVGPVSPAGEGCEERARRELLAHLRAEAGGREVTEMEVAVARARLRPPAAYGALLRNLHRALAGPQRPCEPGCPVLVLCGAEDRTTPPYEAVQVAAATAGARLEVLPEAGHYPFAERPEETAEQVVRFLAAVLSEPAGGQ